MLAAYICWAIRTVVFERHSCASIGELKIALAIGRQKFLRDRVLTVNTAVEHGARCNLYIGPLLQPFYHGPPGHSDSYNVVGELGREDRSYYGPSQLAEIYCHDTNSSVHVVPLEMSINLVQHPPEGATLCMSLIAIRGIYERPPAIRLHGRLSNDLRQPIQLRHYGDHSTVAIAQRPDRYSSLIVRRTLYQQHIYWHGHNPWWQCMTYVTIASEEEGPIDLVTSDSDSDNA